MFSSERLVAGAIVMSLIMTIGGVPVGLVALLVVVAVALSHESCAALFVRSTREASARQPSSPRPDPLNALSDGDDNPQPLEPDDNMTVITDAAVSQPVEADDYRDSASGRTDTQRIDGQSYDRRNQSAKQTEYMMHMNIVKEPDYELRNRWTNFMYENHTENTTSDRFTE